MRSGEHWLMGMPLVAQSMAPFMSSANANALSEVSLATPSSWVANPMMSAMKTGMVIMEAFICIH